MNTNKWFAIIFVICIIVFTGCNKEEISNSNDSDQAVDNQQVENRDDEYLNSFFHILIVFLKILMGDLIFLGVSN